MNCVHYKRVFTISRGHYNESPLYIYSFVHSTHIFMRMHTHTQIYTHNWKKFSKTTSLTNTHTHTHTHTHTQLPYQHHQHVSQIHKHPSTSPNMIHLCKSEHENEISGTSRQLTRYVHMAQITVETRLRAAHTEWCVCVNVCACWWNIPCYLCHLHYIMDLSLGAHTYHEMKRH